MINITFDEIQLLKERVEGGLPLKKIGLLWNLSPEQIRQKLFHIMIKIQKMNRRESERTEDLSEYLSIRTVQALLSADIKTVSQCKATFKQRGEYYFLQLRGIGKKGFYEIFSMCKK